MPKIKILSKQFERKRGSRWEEKAALQINDNWLKYSINRHEMIRVTFGDNILYQGYSIQDALQAWRNA
jgi:hypothetical protein